MSSTIDWSKAPEGATHYLPETDAWYASWFKRVYGVWFSMLEHNDDAWDVDRDMGNAEAHLVEKPVVWNGEGLPPVGTVCECQNDNFDWLQGTVVHVGVDRGSKLAIMQCEHEMLWGEVGEFRPVRTPEQVAAEEREKAVDEMVTVWKRTMGRFASEERGLAEMLYDAGYRKVEQP